MRHFCTIIALFCSLVICGQAALADSAMDWADGEQALENNELDKAIGLFNKAIAGKGLDDEKLSYVWFGKGFAYFRQKKWEEAVTCFDQVLKLNPKHTGAYVYRGKVRVREGRLKEAEEDFTKAILHNPKAAYPYLNRAKLFLEQKKYKPAITDAELALRVDADHPDAYWVIAKAREATNDLSGALEALVLMNRAAPSARVSQAMDRMKEKIDAQIKRKDEALEKRIKGSQGGLGEIWHRPKDGVED